MELQLALAPIVASLRNERMKRAGVDQGKRKDIIAVPNGDKKHNVLSASDVQSRIYAQKQTAFSSRENILLAV